MEVVEGGLLENCRQRLERRIHPMSERDSEAAESIQRSTESLCEAQCWQDAGVQQKSNVQAGRERGGEMIVEAYARYKGHHISEHIKKQNDIDDKDMYNTLQLHRFAEKKRTALKHHDVDSIYFDECRQQCLQDIETIKDPLLW